MPRKGNTSASLLKKVLLSEHKKHVQILRKEQQREKLNSPSQRRQSRTTSHYTRGGKRQRKTRKIFRGLNP